MNTLFDIPDSIRRYLDFQGISYQIIAHARDFSAQRTAHDTFTPGRSFAKTVIIWIDNYYAMAVIGADRVIDFSMLKDELGVWDAGMATEAEVARLFPDCEPGAEPPFGAIYGMPVLVSRELAKEEVITFNGGTHEDCIRMPYADFARVAEPEVLDFTRKAT